MMGRIWQHPWFFLPVGIFLLVTAGLAYTVPYGSEITVFNPYRVEPFNSFFRMCTWWGESWFWLIPGGICLWKRPRYAIILAAAGLLIIPISYVVKDQIGTDRPITYFANKGQETTVVTVPEVRLNRGQTSFPSGHTMSAFGLFTLCSLMIGPNWRKTGLTLAVIAMLVGISRIFLVQHFLIDIFGGALLGILISLSVWWGFERYMPRRKSYSGNPQAGSMHDLPK